MNDVRAYAEPISIFMDVDVDEEHSIFYNDSFSQDNYHFEPLSQHWVNVSRDTCLIFTAPKPQVCPPLSLPKFPTATTSLEECSQLRTSSVPAAFSPQPSPEFLASLGIKVRDFACENRLPAIVPVPRVPRQVQPVPQTLKRSQREWEGEEEGEGSKDSSSLRSPSRRTPPKKSRSLERKPTEPLEATTVRHTRALERIAFHGGCSIITTPIRSIPSLSTPHRSLSASPPTSPLTPPLSHIESQDSELVRTPSAFPFIVHVDDSGMIPTRPLDPALQAASIHPVLFTSFPSNSQPPTILSRPSCSPLHLPRDGSPSRLVDLSLEPPLPIRKSGGDRPTDDTGRMTPPPIRYQLRQRPIMSSHATISSRRSRPQSRTAKSTSLPRRK